MSLEGPNHIYKDTGQFRLTIDIIDRQERFCKSDKWC